MHEETLHITRSARGPLPAAGHLLKGSTAIALLGGLVSIPWLGFQRALDLIPGIFVVLVLPSLAIVEALGWTKHRDRPAFELRFDLTGLEVEGQRFELAKLTWRRRPDGLLLDDGNKPLHLAGMTDRVALERALERHTRRARERYGAGRSEVPEALVRTRDGR